MMWCQRPSLLSFLGEDSIVAEITKLSVGQALDKLRGADAPKSRMTQLDANIGALDQEIKRMRATGRRLDRDQQTASIGHDDLKANTGRIKKRKLSGIIFGIAIVIAVFVWTCWLFWK
jgi:hypothetical protein